MKLKTTLIAAALCVTASFAQATSLIAIQTVTLGGTDSALFQFDPFDPADGELERADVHFSVTAQSLVNTVDLGVALPAPIPGIIEKSISLVDLNAPFRSIAPSRTFTQVFSPGQATTLTLLSVYDFQMSFVAGAIPTALVVDPDGTSGPASGLVIEGTAEEFVQGVAPVPHTGAFQLSMSPTDANFVPIATLLSGNMTVTYRYTEHAPQPDPDPLPDTPAVPLPAGAPLVLSGLAALALFKRRQTRTA